MMPTETDVIIIGGGVIGCWTAWHLQQQGAQVTIVDRGPIGGGASFGNCGYICPSHVHPLCGPGAVRDGLRKLVHFDKSFSITPRWDPQLWRWLVDFAKHCNVNDFRHASQARHALLDSSMSLYREFAEDRRDRLRWQEQGLLTVHRHRGSLDAYESRARELQDEFGLNVQRYDADALCDLEPALRPGLAGGWYFPDDAHLSPSDLLAELRRELIQAGVQIREHCDVDELQRGNDRLDSIRLGSGEELRADRFVLATGAEAGRFASILGCRIPVIPGKGYSITQPTPTDAPTIPMIFEQDHVAVTPLGDALRIGSTMQLAGFSRTLPRSRIDLLKRSARAHLVTPLSDSHENLWCGWRPMTPDGLPCIDHAPATSNVVVAAGNGMVGMASGAGTGRLAAELSLGRPPHIDATPFRLSRFSSQRS
ncbi:FAD-dependent oxidoreductase [Roseiconus nitratireducens]|uniref:FAD-dependent oxidoreductase n=1 Tax=Roseiconus nitratireducens TaxID=2605748 RepID=A0A5M6DHP3_9BACT|nr:FAD-dependent oxidoreductase [Roseiconus nitratireducens]KAA5547041.1 FAD-dependent oxidoreductase [Roseiconus nitratireducens]